MTDPDWGGSIGPACKQILRPAKARKSSFPVRFRTEEHESAGAAEAPKPPGYTAASTPGMRAMGLTGSGPAGGAAQMWQLSFEILRVLVEAVVSIATDIEEIEFLG